MEIKPNEKPDWNELEQLAEELDWTLIIPTEGTDIPAQGFARARSEASGIEEKEPFLDGARGGKMLQINMEGLRKLIYEHRRYSWADGFSDTELDVLRAVEYGPSRVSYSEIEESDWLEGDPARSTIYKALEGLIEKELVERVQQNMYEYTGPSTARKQ